MPIIAPTGVGNYPSIEYVFNLTRININDTFAGANGVVGEGRIFTDSWTPSVNILNQAIQALQRDLEGLGLPTTRELTQIISGQTFVLTAAALSGTFTIYTGVIPGGALNGMLGRRFTITGFINGGNNVTAAYCVASSATSITLVNGTGVNETHAGSATSGGLTPIHGPLGLSVADPTVVPYLAFYGYWDGSVLQPTPVLPPDLLVPLKLRARVTGTTNPFIEIHEFPSGLYSCNQTALGLGGWEWFSDRLNFNGSLATMDLEMRYTAGVSPFLTSLAPTDFPTTFVPFLDSADALAYKCAYIFCAPRLPKDGAAELNNNYMLAMQGMANRWIAQPKP